MTDNQRLRQLPSVDDVVRAFDKRFPKDLVVSEARRVIDSARERLKRGEEVDTDRIPSEIGAALERLARPSLRRVINATGVVLHTNLGRAPLGPVSFPEGYSNLEFDLAAGRRGKRDVHAAELLERLLGVPGIVVNNNAAAVFLALHELAQGGEAIVSRGELIEIGDGFRIPEIMVRSGAQLREVGTTNRTHIDDYRSAINERTRLILRVHPSNFHMEGFTSRPELRELAMLAHERGIPLYEDLGSGCLVDLRPFGIDEPVVSESIRAGADLVSFSGDKLLGGPQAGILAGRQGLVARLRANPMFRALRVDKLIYGALGTTLRNVLLERYEKIPALRMIRAGSAEIRERAERLQPQLGCELIEGESVIGGGSTPAQSIPTWLLAIDADAAGLERRLREQEPAVIARIEQDRLLIDLRTVQPEEEQELVAAVRQARSR